MSCAAKNFETLIVMEGFSEATPKNHFAIYQGYMTNNKFPVYGTKGVDHMAAFQKNVDWKVAEAWF